MTYDYWAIVGGLLVLLGLFFVCMEIVYARAKNGADGVRGGTGQPSVKTSSDSKHAA